MKNYEQMRVIMNWERDNWKLGNCYKNALAKKSINAVQNELAELKKSAKGVSFSVVSKGGKRIYGDKIVTFKKG